MEDRSPLRIIRAPQSRLHGPTGPSSGVASPRRGRRFATLVAVFPANVWMAQHPERYRVPGGRATLIARLPFQAVFIALVRAAMAR